MPSPDRKAEIQNLISAITPALQEHLGTLSVRRSQLVLKDHYGREMREEWDAELDYFILHFLYGSKQAEFNGAKGQAGAYVGSTYERVFRIIDVAAANWSEKRGGISWLELSPKDFEVACCEELRNAGWDAHVTRASWDQGIDVIAKSNGLKLVVQCKKYEDVVGNKAVQEIIAGREFEKANFAAVVSLTDFTKSAHQLAASASVLLLHPEKIRSLLDVNRFDPRANFSGFDSSSAPQTVSELLESFIKPLFRAEEKALSEKIQEERETENFLNEDEDIEGEDSADEVLLIKAIEVLRATKRASTSTIQRRLRIGYNRAARLMDLMEEQGIVGPENGSDPRDILVDLDTI